MTSETHGGLLTSLLMLARELSAITCIRSLRDALPRFLPLLPSRDVCIVRCSDGKWEAVAGAPYAPRRRSQYAWTPLVTGERTIGMLGIGRHTDGQPTGEAADAAVTLLAIGAQNILVIEQLRQDSIRDTLTGCFNRGHAMEVMESELRRSDRTGLPLSILMIDVDGFKEINDQYGHLPGDAVLTAIASLLQWMLRQSDIRCRLGGDEFLVMLPDTAHADALSVGEAVRQAIEQLSVPSIRGMVKVTASIGVATTSPAGDLDAATIIDRADQALYRAKQAGRNRVASNNGVPAVFHNPRPWLVQARPA